MPQQPQTRLLRSWLSCFVAFALLWQSLFLPMAGMPITLKGVPTDDGSGANDLVTTFAYDEMGRKIGQSDAKGQVTTFGYDERERMYARKLPDGKTEAMAFAVL